MTIIFTKTELNNKTKIRRKLENFTLTFRNTPKNYNEDEISSLVLSAIRANEMGGVDIKKSKAKCNIS